jgi:hypothetical protein
MLTEASQAFRDTEIRRFNLPLKPDSERPTRPTSMTALIGMVCTNGIVICADQQVSAADSYKYNERKISVETGSDWGVIFAYAGLPTLMKEVSQKITKQLNTIPVVTTDSVHEVADDVFTALGRHYADLELSMLIATSTVADAPKSVELLAFDGKALHVAEGLTPFGVGDSSLIRFLADALYSPMIDTGYGIPLGVYLIEKAKAYIDHCGGPTDAISVVGGKRWAWASSMDIAVMASTMNNLEKNAIKAIIPGAFHP